MRLKELMENQELKDYKIEEFYGDANLLAAKRHYGWGDEVGTFSIYDCNLKGLKGAPQIVHGSFNGSENDFTNLVGGPRYVSNRYSVNKCNLLTSLEGAPEYVGRNFECVSCDLTQDSLQYLPKYIGQSLYLHDGNHKITSLHNIHMYVHHIGRYMLLPPNISSHIMGLMKIRGLKEVLDDTPINSNSKISQVCDILNRHLDGKGNFFDCLEELEDAGLDEFAQL